MIRGIRKIRYSVLIALLLGAPIVSLSAEKADPDTLQKRGNQREQLRLLFNNPKVIQAEKDRLAQEKKAEEDRIAQKKQAEENRITQEKQIEAARKAKLVQETKDRLAREKKAEELARQKAEKAVQDEIIARQALERKRQIAAIKAAESLSVRQAEEIELLRGNEKMNKKSMPVNWILLKAHHQRDQAEWKINSAGVPFDFDTDWSVYKPTEFPKEIENAAAPPEQTPKQPLYQDTKDGWLDAKTVAEWCDKFQAWDSKADCFKLTKGNQFTRTAINACGSLPYFHTHIAPCLKGVAGKTFEPILVKYCTDLGDGSNLDHKANCIRIAAGASVQADAVTVCTKTRHGNWAVDCLKVIIGKTFDDSDLVRCGGKDYEDQIVHCLHQAARTSQTSGGAPSRPSRPSQSSSRPPILGLPAAPGSTQGQNSGHTPEKSQQIPGGREVPGRMNTFRRL